MPALFTSMSRRCSRAWNEEAASAMDAKDVRSSGRCSISAVGQSRRISAMASFALEAVRAARYIRAGECAAR